MASSAVYKRISYRVISVILVLLMVLGSVPAVRIKVFAADKTFTAADGAVYIDSSYNGKSVIIENGVFSVTVNNAQNVTIIFDNVVINRRSLQNNLEAKHNTTVPNLYYVSQQLGATGKAQVCPFLIVGDSTVTAQFRGTCTFYAGTNDCTVSNRNVYTADYDGCGFAGIQIESGSTLIIDDAMDLTVFGAHQHAIPDANGYVPDTTTLYTDALRANATISGVYTDPFNTRGTDNAYKGPNGRAFHNQSGGAGIGGGADLNTSSSGTSTYTYGTPGNIIINKGNIEAWGGVQAAGIGGGVNSAATTGLIQINGGNIIAHGGRFGAGIGDGDSVDGSGKTSTQFRDAESIIEINGGNLTVYGGVASPGIGSADEISHSSGFGENAERKMEISINGGNVSAFSGFPKVFSGTYPSEAPAAIGAGSSTKLPPNSIYIGSGSTQLDASFSNYAITENGVNANAVPTINIDSDGYLLMLRTGDYFSTATRELVLYLPQKIENPASGEMCTRYIDQKTHTEYYVDDVGVVYDTNWEVVPDFDTPITLYIDENSQRLKSIDLAYYFRAIAITLPNPSIYGGMYALAIPTDGIADADLPLKDDFISITVVAHQQGTQSGVVKFPSGHNMEIDGKADPLTRLDVYDEIEFDTTQNGLVGSNFSENVYAYTVYVDPYCTEANVYVKWTDKNSQIFLDDVLKAETNDKGVHDMVFTVDMSDTSQKVIRIKKMDNKISFGAVSYKITIIKRGDYILTLSDPSKVYDGQQVNVVPQAVTSVQHILSDESDGGSSLEVADMTAGTKSYSHGPQTLRMYYRKSGNSTTRYDILLTTEVTVNASAYSSANSSKTVEYMVHFYADKSGSTTKGNNDYDDVYTGWRVTYSANASPVTEWYGYKTTESGSWTKPNSNPSIRVGSGRNSAAINITINRTTGAVTIVYSNQNTYTIFDLGSVKTESSDSSTKDEKQAEAQEAMDNGASSGSFAYEENSITTYSQPFILYKYAAPNNNTTKNTTSSSAPEDYDVISFVEKSSGAWVISEKLTPVSIPDHDLTLVEYSFTQVADADGNLIPEGQRVSTPTRPKNAGSYRVDAILKMETYTAVGTIDFEITKRKLTVIQIENWLGRIVGETFDPVIADPGAITLSNVVSGDDVTMVVDTANGGSVFFNPDSTDSEGDHYTATYRDDKISIRKPILVGDPIVIANYYFEYTEPGEFIIRVFGQIVYDMMGAMFIKTQDGQWRKYQDEGAEIQITDSNATYQSPKEQDTSNGAYLSHAKYMMLRTANAGADEGRYAVDVEYGELSYSFFHSRWNVNTLSYEANELSRWDGNNGFNNKISIINYSNCQIKYQVSADIDFLYAPTTQGSEAGISAKVTTDEQGSTQIEKDAWTLVDAATAGDASSAGNAKWSTFYVIISGVPQMSNAQNVHVGSVTLKLSPVT